MNRINFKYLERSYRFVFQESGHIAQNVLLGAENIGLGAVPIGGFVDDILNYVINVDGIDRSVIYCIVIGKKKINK